MSWLRNHIRHYVVPGIFAIIEAQREQPKHSRALSLKPLWLAHEPEQPSVPDVKYPVRNLRPSRKFKRKEIGLIYTALRSSGVPISYKMEAALRYKGIFGHRTTGSDDDRNQIHNIVKNSIKTLRRILKKNPGRKLILPGRDVWMWSVLCHKLSIPHIFDPRVSRIVSRNEEALRSIVDEWKITDETIIFDTGFAGSIYDAIVRTSGIRCHNLMLSTMRKNRRTFKAEQLYPNHKGARRKALAIEYLPKYQKTGTVRGNKPVQYLADLDEFIQAACLTVWFWYYQSPAWIKQGEQRCKVVDCHCKSCKLWKGGTMPTTIV